MASLAPNSMLSLCAHTALSCSGIASARLELEITESVRLQDTKQTLSILLRLQHLSVKLARDDFGTGTSGLSNLQKFKSIR